MAHVHLGTLAYIANLLGQESVFKQLLEFAEDDWIDDHGCQYVTLTKTHLMLRLLPDLIPDGVDIELVKVTGTLSLRASQDHSAWLIVVVIGYVASFVLMAAVLRAGMPVGVAYGI